MNPKIEKKIDKAIEDQIWLFRKYGHMELVWSSIESVEILKINFVDAIMKTVFKKHSTKEFGMEYDDVQSFVHRKINDKSHSLKIILERMLENQKQYYAMISDTYSI